MSTSKKTITGRFDPDTYERFENYRDEHNLNKSTAARRLVERGLKAEQEETGGGGSFGEKVTAVDLMIVGAIVILAEVVGLWAYVGLGGYAIALYVAHRLDEPA